MTESSYYNTLLEKPLETQGLQEDNVMNDLEVQQYLFDLQGYLVIEDVLSPEELATLNRLIDQQELPHTGKGSKVW